MNILSSSTIRKFSFLLVVLTATIYSNSLLNDFTGDDFAIVVENTFYSSLVNIPKIFTKGYTTDPDSLDRGMGHDYGSGAVAYRPVPSMTYFMDHAFWGKSPFGYHLTSLVFHTINVLLVFAVFLLFMAPEVAFFSAALFAVHPVQTEAVCSIGYRADLLAAFFILFSVLSWSRFRQSGHFGWGAGTLAGYFLALFSKESAFFLPFILGAWDLLSRPGLKPAGHVWRRWSFFFVLVASFYLYIYLRVFPNPLLHKYAFSGRDIAEHLSNVLRNWDFNVLSLIFPLSVTAAPPLYHFPAGPLMCTEWMVPLILSIAVLGALAVFLWQQKGKVIFWFVWFFVFYIPVSGLVANPNPVASRYLYVPSMGFCALAGILLWQGRKKGFIMFFALAALSMGTFFNNFLWKSNITISRQWIKDYPDFYKGHLVLGVEYFKRGIFDKAVEELAPFWQEFMGAEPLGLYCLAEGEYQLKNMSRAVFFFDVLIQEHPAFADGYFGRAKCFLDEGDILRAVEYFKKAWSLESKPMYLEYLVHKDLSRAVFGVQ